jgi:cell division protein FtsZ
MYQPAARAPQPVHQPRTTQVEEQRPQRETRPSAFNGFNIFGRSKPAQREEEWDERPEVNTRALTQGQPLFGDEFDDEIEIPTFLRKQAN